MEYRRNDMYVQAKRGGKKPVAKAEKPMMAAEVTMEKSIELDMVIEKVEDRCAVPPILELPQDGGCGYCLTVGMSYTPVQKWGKLYEPEEALVRGTIFPELDYPFMGKGGQKA